MRWVKKTSLYIEPEVDRRLQRRAAEAGVSKAEYIRRALADAVRPECGRKPRGRGIFRGPPDLAEELDAHLSEDGFGDR